MIDTLIFDFGDVFINLDKEGALKHTLSLLQINSFPDDLTKINIQYEQGLIETDTFIKQYQHTYPQLSKDEIIASWNILLKDFPEHRLEWLKKLSEAKEYKLILLSNTNTLHIDWIKENVDFYEDFKAQFNKFYLSHEIKLRKPNSDIYEFVLNENNLTPEKCLFIDDTPENIVSARKLKINTWNINPKTEDITNLFEVKSHLF
ncbi:HAD family hydrolase [Mangrovimonas aestuarii]|uniref:HAD family hydrolase n=1 Tax=Mangrovimonas aestuarii TaxID=3018443 RepID=UPI0023780E8C|nr:HAD family phosphatase [Mangrovimonas aestuarii]